MIWTKEETIQAYTEIGCLLKYFPNSFIEKLPNKLLEIINSKADRKYLIDVSTLHHCYKYLSVPPQSVVQRWLRETKNLHISIIRNSCGYTYDICKADNGTHISEGIFKGPNDGGQWDIYEEALEAGIQEALKLI